MRHKQGSISCETDSEQKLGLRTSVAAAFSNLLRTDYSQICPFKIQDIIVYDFFTAEDERNILTTPHKQFKAIKM